MGQYCLSIYHFVRETIVGSKGNDHDFTYREETLTKRTETSILLSEEKKREEDGR